MDSYLMLTSSLRALCKSFSITYPKGIFPFLLNTVNYIGSVPEYNLFNNLSLEDYNSYKETFKDQI